MSTKLWIFPIATAFFCLFGDLPAVSPRPVAQDPRLRSDFWLENYPRLDADSPQAGRAQRIFERVRNVVERPDQRQPRLILIEAELDPLAIALEDGGIVLSQGGLELAFQAAEPTLADSHLAFILAHELAHLVRGDFNHSMAFFSSRNAAREGETSLEEILLPDRADLQRRELQADQQGLIYMTLAGFDPWAILAEEDHFFDRWVTQAPGRGAYGISDHPTPSQRALFLRNQLSPVVDRLSLFHFGTLMYQIRDFDLAIELLEEFRLTFAGAAVLNNLGLAYYQRGLKQLARCQGREVVRFRLPTAIDPETVAQRFRMRGSKNTCVEQIEDLRIAQRELRAAVKRAPDYYPGLLNLTSVLITSGHHAEAYVGPSTILVESYPGPRSSLVQLLALHLYDQDNLREDFSQEILVGFAKLAGENADSAEIAYNHSAIVREIRGHLASLPLWQRFLKLEPVGVFAEFAREQLELSPSKVQAGTSQPPETPVEIGEITPQSRSWLRENFLDPPEVEIRFGGTIWRFLRNERFRVLHGIGPDSARIAMLEDNKMNLSRETVFSMHGPPKWTVPAEAGDFLLYDRFGYQLSEKGRGSLILFSFPPSKPAIK